MKSSVFAILFWSAEAPQGLCINKIRRSKALQTWHFAFFLKSRNLMITTTFSVNYVLIVFIFWNSCDTNRKTCGDEGSKEPPVNHMELYYLFKTKWSYGVDTVVAYEFFSNSECSSRANSCKNLVSTKFVQSHFRKSCNLKGMTSSVLSLDHDSFSRANYILN